MPDPSTSTSRAADAPGRPAPGASTNAAGDIGLFEPAFACRERSLVVETSFAPARLGHFGHRIARRPGDLMAHTQRILLAAAVADAERLFSAMLDLAAVLDGKGLALRRTLLERCGRTLTPAQREAIAATLDERPTGKHDARYRLLSDPRTDSVVRRLDDAAAESVDAGGAHRG